ncbi:MAG: hypothetical protein E6Q76_05610 [Rhizobium sp.]|nr:MAG: hypothetical protein E6Q76_05610 [Rhizobium sp.]
MNHPSSVLRKVLGISLASALAACGAGGFDTLSQSQHVTVAVGSVSNGTFSGGTLAVSSNPTSSTGSTSIRVNVMNTTTGQPVDDGSATVNFTVDCTQQGQGAFDNSSPKITGGTAVTVFNNQGCTGNHTVYATVVVKNPNASGASTSTSSTSSTPTPNPGCFSSAFPSPGCNADGTSSTPTEPATFTLTATASLSLLSPAPVHLGSYDAQGVFHDGQIVFTPDTIDQGASGQVRMAILDDKGANTNANGNTVTISSNCLTANTASLSPGVVTFSSGSATFLYTVKGCATDDPVSASVTLDGRSVIATGTAHVVPPAAGSVTFVNAIPSSLTMSGLGKNNQSQVTFKVSSTNNQPLANARVTFTAKPTGQGVTLSPAVAYTDATGSVTTTVKAGGSNLPIVVTAATDSGQSGSSASILVTSGFPAQSSTSLAVDCPNIEGWDADGQTAKLTFRASDRYNAPVSDSTPISFLTEGGSVAASCSTSAGSCTANLVAQNPRPTSQRVHVLAYTAGEESFTDTNGNGAYDAGEPFNDVGEPYLDLNENGIKDASEPYVDANGNGSYDPPNNTFDGITCSGGACSIKNGIDVGKSAVVIFSRSRASLSVTPAALSLGVAKLPITIAAVGASVADASKPGLQPLPAQTQISVSTDVGTLSATNFVVPCTSDAGASLFQSEITPPTSSSAQSGFLTVTALTPMGVRTTQQFPITFTPASSPTSTAALAQMVFTSLDHQIIGIQGSPVNHVATLVFTALGADGNPLPNVALTFNVSPTTGGIRTQNVSTTTDASGKGSIQVVAGSVATNVRVDVTGSLNGQSASASSNQLVISTGIPNYTSVSLSATTLNIEGGSYDGTKTTITARLADRFHNPVPDGTAVSFRTNGGSIQSSCVTANGACSVDYTSQSPRTSNHRYTVMAFAVGEDTFTDANGNGAYDQGEPLIQGGEPYVDENENGKKDSTDTIFIDTNGNNAYDGPDGKYHGLQCNSGCATTSTTQVYAQVALVGSSSAANIVASPSAATVNKTTGPTTFTFTVTDTAGQPMPAGTNYSVTTTYGTLDGTTSDTQPNTNVPGGYSFQTVLKPAEPTTSDPNADTAPGILTVKAITPNGVVTKLNIPIN